MEEEKKEENKEEKDCLLGNKTLKLTMMKKRKNKYLKGLTKSNPAKKSITIIIFSPKKNCNSQLVFIILMSMIYLKLGIKK